MAGSVEGMLKNFDMCILTQEASSLDSAAARSVPSSSFALTGLSSIAIDSAQNTSQERHPLVKHQHLQSTDPPNIPFIHIYPH